MIEVFIDYFECVCWLLLVIVKVYCLDLCDFVFLSGVVFFEVVDLDVFWDWLW